LINTKDIARCGDINNKRPPLVVWKMVTKPKLKARLVVLRLRLQNDVLLRRIVTSFSLKQTYPGCIYYGPSIIQMDKFQGKLGNVPYGGRVYSGYSICTKAWNKLI
jgi:hypothetical protein